MTPSSGLRPPTPPSPLERSALTLPQAERPLLGLVADQVPWSSLPRGSHKKADHRVTFPTVLGSLQLGDKHKGVSEGRRFNFMSADVLNATPIVR